MKYLFVYELGDSPECSEVKDVPDRDAAKAHARESLEQTLKASSADSASIGIGEYEDEEEQLVHWLGAYALERGGDPVWSAD